MNNGPFSLPFQEVFTAHREMFPWNTDREFLMKRPWQCATWKPREITHENFFHGIVQKKKNLRHFQGTDVIKIPLKFYHIKKAKSWCFHGPVELSIPWKFSEFMAFSRALDLLIQWNIRTCTNANFGSIYVLFTDTGFENAWCLISKAWKYITVLLLNLCVLNHLNK